ncbi:MAG: hypothetical protein ACFE0P_00480 [Oceanicaulis sp.]
MKRLTLSLVSAAAMAAPALAQPAGETWDEDDLIPMPLVSMEELSGADVYWADGDDAGNVIDVEVEDGDVVSLLVHEMVPDQSVISRYRIMGEDISGYDEDQRTVILKLEQRDYRVDF